MISNADIREFILEPAMKDLSHRLRSVEIMFDQGSIDDRDFHQMRIYFPGPETFNEGLIEDSQVCRAVSHRIIEVISEWYAQESGGINPIISGIGVSESFELLEWPNDWEAMAGDIPPDLVPYCLVLWIGFAFWPEVEIAFE